MGKAPAHHCGFAARSAGIQVGQLAALPCKGHIYGIRLDSAGERPVPFRGIGGGVRSRMTWGVRCGPGMASMSSGGQATFMQAMLTSSAIAQLRPVPVHTFQVMMMPPPLILAGTELRKVDITPGL